MNSLLKFVNLKKKCKNNIQSNISYSNKSLVALPVSKQSNKDRSINSNDLYKISDWCLGYKELIQGIIEQVTCSIGDIFLDCAGQGSCWTSCSEYWTTWVVIAYSCRNGSWTRLKQCSGRIYRYSAFPLRIPKANETHNMIPAVGPVALGDLHVCVAQDKRQSLT